MSFFIILNTLYFRKFAYQMLVCHGSIIFALRNYFIQAVAPQNVVKNGYEIRFDPSKIRYGNLDEEDNCYRIEIANLLTRTANDAAIDVESFDFWNSLEITFSITGIGDLSGSDRETDPEE